MLRREVLCLYRKILKVIRQVPDEQHRQELVAWARNDFRNNVHLTQEIEIKMMMSYGRRMLKELETSLSLAK